MPNITGKTGETTGSGPQNLKNESANSAIFTTVTAYLNNVSLTGSGLGNNSEYFTIDASRSNAIYGNSETVQPASITAIMLIKY